MVRNLELRLSEYLKHVKYDLGMSQLSYKVNLGGNHSRATSKMSFGSLASKVAAKMEQDRQEKIKG